MRYPAAGRLRHTNTSPLLPFGRVSAVCLPAGQCRALSASRTHCKPPLRSYTAPTRRQPSDASVELSVISALTRLQAACARPESTTSCELPAELVRVCIESNAPALHRCVQLDEQAGLVRRCLRADVFVSLLESSRPMCTSVSALRVLQALVRSVHESSLCSPSRRLMPRRPQHTGQNLLARVCAIG